MPNGTNSGMRVIGAALRHPKKSEVWTGYWQRSAA